MTLLQPGQFWSVSNMPSSTSAGHFGHTVDIDLRYREQPVHGIVRTTEPDLSHYFCSSQLRGTPCRSCVEEGHTRPSLALLRPTRLPMINTSL